MVEWETWEITIEPHKLITTDDHVPCALYGKDNNILEQDGRSRFKNTTKGQNKLLRMTNQDKLRSFHTAPKYELWIQCPTKLQPYRDDRPNKG